MGGPKPGACAAGVGTRAYAQTIPRLLSRAVAPAISVPLAPRCRPVPSPVRGPRSFLLPPLCPSRSRSRYRRGPALSLSIAVGTHRRAPPITAECARSKAPQARVVIRSGVLSIWVIANANKDNTWRTIMSCNYSAYRI